MLCPKCNLPMDIDVELIGGCSGHPSSDSLCYCDSPDVRCVWRCDKRIETKDKNGRKRTHCCTQAPISIYELGDRYAIERWLQTNYRG